ncbi:unnamed protein product [Protopolystoma xenopodis]|uniref:2Fe-2S ferredoxin-type domain-containing protein n=1 Tax=Protopolystoma xenopodis TaxID=117903 RepID=A0A448X8E8_9PLAT|nr:unnamed protein product [Protopolystoma xenopodis]
MLDVALDNDVDIDGFGACEGTLACSTCHLILSKEDFDKCLKQNPMSLDEIDLLDIAYDLKNT